MAVIIIICLIHKNLKNAPEMTIIVKVFIINSNFIIPHAIFKLFLFLILN